MIDVKVEVDEQRMKALASVPERWRNILSRWLGETAGDIKQEIRSVLHVRTGHMWRNVGWTIRGDSEMIGEVGTGVGFAKNVVYARIHEHGGDITPKKTRALTIPLPGVKGVAKNYGKLFILKKEGRAFLAKKEGGFIKRLFGKGSVKALFLLATRVTIPARPYAKPVMDKRGPILEQRIEAVAKEI